VRVNLLNEKAVTPWSQWRTAPTIKSFLEPLAGRERSFTYLVAAHDQVLCAPITRGNAHCMC